MGGVLDLPLVFTSRSLRALRLGSTDDSGRLSSCGDLACSNALAHGLFDNVVEGGSGISDFRPVLLLLLRSNNEPCPEDRAAGPRTADLRANEFDAACEVRFVSDSCDGIIAAMAGCLPVLEDIPVSIRSGNGMGRAEAPETMLFGVAGMGVKLLFLMFKRGGRWRELLPSESLANPPALLDLVDGGGGTEGGPGNVKPLLPSCLYSCSPDKVLDGRGAEGPAVGVGPADVDLRA